jgi:hypothetical protein
MAEEAPKKAPQKKASAKAVSDTKLADLAKKFKGETQVA